MRRERGTHEHDDDDKPASSHVRSVSTLPKEEATAIAIEALALFAASCDDYIGPQDSSVFAAFVMMERHKSDAAQVSSSAFSVRTVSFGIGTHAVGVASGRDEADAAFCLRDLHAEILARRGLIAYLLQCRQQLMLKTEDGNDSRGDNNNSSSGVGNPLQRHLDDGSVAVRDNVSFHLFVTQTPCGDASIFPGAAHGARCFRHISAPGEGDTDDATSAQKQVAEHEERLELALPRRGEDEKNNNDDSKKKQHVAVLAVSRHHNGVDDDKELCTRLKPGRGIRSTAMSCSDEICKWICLGLQGAVAGLVLPLRVELESVVVLCDPPSPSASSFLSTAATLQRLDRALIQRVGGIPQQCGRPQQQSRPFRVATVEISGDNLCRPFLHTSESETSTSHVCVVGHITLQQQQQQQEWEVRQLTGKDGAPHGSSAKSRAALLKKSVSCRDLMPKVEMTVSSRGILRSVLRILSATAKERRDDDAARTVSFEQLKRTNVAYAEGKRVFHSHPHFREWVNDSFDLRHHDVELSTQK